MDIGIMEACAAVVVLAGGLTPLFGAFKWGGSMMDKRVKDSEDRLIDKIAVEVAAIKVTLDGHHHRFGNMAQNVEALRLNDIAQSERTTRLEINFENQKEWQKRTEHQLEKMASENDKARTEIIDSIRELRNVALKD